MTQTRIKLFVIEDVKDEEIINDWLKDNAGVCVKDIKISTCPTEYVGIGSFHQKTTIMIIY